MNLNDPPADPTAAAVTISSTAKLPPFHKTDPSFWFIQVETQFAAERVTSQSSKFNKVISQLPEEVLQQCTSLDSTPGDKPYDDLKIHLTDLYGVSQNVRLKTLFETTSIGDQRPSHALNRMRYIAGTSTPDDIIKTLWMRQLPASTQEALITSQLGGPTQRSTSTHDRRCQLIKLNPTLAATDRPAYQTTPGTCVLNYSAHTTISIHLQKPGTSSTMEDTTSRSGEDDDLDEAAQSVSLPSSSRQQRNQAEKKRRDTLNQFITELGMLVPMVSASPKKLDKTSVLRLAAAYLRVHQTIAKTKEEYHRLSIPIKWCQLILDGMDGMLLVITASGKIVFISHNIEALLGHSQTDLLGQSLFNITSLEDHEELKANLMPTPAPAEDLDRPSTSASTSSAGSEESWKRDPERRSFYLRLRHKSTPRGEQPQYEVVHVVGHLRVPSPPPPKKRSPGGGSSSEGAQHLNQEIVLVAMMKPFKEIRITSTSFIEASREEWISRHLIDGTIVYSDHRISVVSGYMAEEVTGDFAFRYMHQDDVRWVLIALRQMYYRGESYGTSCYRLMSKTGDYIYIRTHGYLELNEDTHSVQSFVCINTLVTKEEGEKQIREMKELFTPMVTGHDSSLVTFTSNSSSMTVQDCCPGTSSNVLTPLKVDDPGELGKAIEQLLSDLPVDQIHPRDSDTPVSDEQYAKCAMVSKTTLPKLQVHCSQVGVMSMPMIKKGPRYQSRPSVITRAKEKRSSVEEQSTSKKLRQEPSPVPPVTSLMNVNRSVIKSRDDYMDVESSDDSSLVPLSRYAASPQGSYTISSPPSSYVISTGQPDQIGYLTSPGDVGGSLLLEPTTSSSTSSMRQPVDLLLNEFITVDSLDTRLDTIDDPLQVGPLDTLSGFWTSDMDSLEDGVVRGHMQLEERIQFQDTQISAIEKDLTLVPISSDGNHIYRSTVTHLKAEHRKQQQMLKTLKQDHQNIQQCSKDQLAVRGAQDIGA